MQDDEKSFITLFVILLALAAFGLFFKSYDDNTWGIGSLGDLNGSKSLSDPFIGGNDVYLEQNSPNYYEGEILASNSGELEVVDSFQGEVTGYASLDSRAQEGMCYSGDPSITASGDKVRRGIVAANFLEFGTKIKIPEYFGDEVFVVKDRMASDYGWGNIDVWMRDQDNAKDFGRVVTKIEVVK